MSHEVECLCNMKDFVDRIGLGYIGVVDIGLFYDKWIRGRDVKPV